jgi:hypothetical protein
MDLETLYGEFIICSCDNRSKFLNKYSINNTKINKECPTFYDCRQCQWTRFKNDPNTTFRIDK